MPEKDAVCEIAGRKNDARRTWKFYDDSGLLLSHDVTQKTPTNTPLTWMLKSVYTKKHGALHGED